MHITARFNVGGKPVLLDEDTGFLRFEIRGAIGHLKENRMDAEGNIHQQQMLNGERVRLPELLEAESATLGSLLKAIEQDEERLRGPLVRNGHLRTTKTMNPVTGQFEYSTDGMKRLDVTGGRKI